MSQTAEDTTTFKALLQISCGYGTFPRDPVELLARRLGCHLHLYPSIPPDDVIVGIRLTLPDGGCFAYDQTITVREIIAERDRQTGDPMGAFVARIKSQLIECVMEHFRSRIVFVETP